MKRRTYNNVLKAIKLIQKKGYDRQTAEKIALQCFDNAEANNNGMSIEWYINKVVEVKQ